MNSSVSLVKNPGSSEQPPRGLLTSEAARLIGVSPDTVRRWIHAGILPAKRLGPGGRIRIDPADLERLFAAEQPSRTEKVEGAQ
jgi:excisionase family DNA binding protein